MAGARCTVCGQEEMLPFRCKFCGAPHCLAHRLPENHACPRVGEARARAREERVRAAVEGPAGLRVRVRGPPRLWGVAGSVRRFARRSATHLLLVVVLAVFLVQVLGDLVLSRVPFRGLATCALALGPCGPFQAAPWGLPLKPWSVATNIVAHAGPIHLLFNALFLYFFGLELERRVGRRLLVRLFLGAGLLAAVGQVAIFDGAVLGASGGIMGILGALTVLAPHLRVIFWFVPVPLWVMTLLFILFDLGGLAGGGTGIANLAHLLGLAVGLGLGVRLRRRGVLPRLASPWASTRRW